MISREIKQELHNQLTEFPVVTVLGPRQAGKTTLVKTELPNYEYVNLELPNIRKLAIDDPKAFLDRYPNKVIFDEIQRASELLSYIQVIVDETQENGQFVITGSHQLELRAAITQSLAGRTGLLSLLPFSIVELSAENIEYSHFADYLFKGFLPRIYDQKQRPQTAYGNYYRTYVERDVRQLINLKNASLFDKFIRLLAGRIGQVINYQSLSADVGVDAKTIKEWLSILEASFIVCKLSPYFENFGKRVIKSPKYYFIDVGLLCYLLGINKKEQIVRDPLVGQLFENLVVIEVMKSRLNQGKEADLYFYRDSHGNEIDLLVAHGRELMGIEIKSATTFDNSFKKQLLKFSENQQKLKQSYIVYAGENFGFSDGIEAINFKTISKVLTN